MKKVFISGAAGGLGKSVVRAFLNDGWFVFIGVRFAGTFTHFENCKEIEIDVTNDESVRDGFAQVDDLHAIVHCVGGICPSAKIEEAEIDDFSRMISLNTTSTFLMLKYSVPLLRETRGSIVTIGARSAQIHEPGKALYNASKAAVQSLTLTVAEELRSEGVRANVILPSIIKTEANLEWDSSEASEKWVAPENIAQTAIFLCSDAASDISGAVLPVYGRI